MQTPAQLTALLAKSNGETLYEHTWHVIERLADQMRLRPNLPSHIGNPRLWHQLYWACLLHDFGKAADGFQKALRGSNRWTHRHEVGSLAFLPWLFPDAGHEDYRWVVAAIVSHHKDADVIRDLYKPGGNAAGSLAADIAAAPLDALWQWLDQEANAWTQRLGFDSYGVERLNIRPQTEAVELIRKHGAAMIEQALKVYRRFLDDTPALRKQAIVTLILRGFIITADHSASAHTGSMPSLPDIDFMGVVQRLNWSAVNLYPHQSQSAQSRGHTVLIAPTGSGKTEAAIFWAFGARPSPSRIFYMLPFQASMNAMRTRLDGMFNNMVGLQHSRAVQALYRVYVEQGDDPRFASQRAQAQKNRSELNYYPVRVLSPYQILKACYRLKGYETILSDLWGSAVILDEIHAYEPKRLALILELARYLRLHYQVRFFVMSATFPDLVKSVLKDVLGDYCEICADHDTFRAFQRHRLHVLPGDMSNDHNTDLIVNDARSGRSVLVCCNTVSRAQEMWRRIRDRLGAGAHTILLHSRLTARDRIAREQQVIRACGMNSRDRKPVVLVATQVIEVSLNIDLDTIYTDPAPLEALIQRFGRINRSRRRDDGGNPLIAPVHVFQAPIPEKNMRPYDLRLLRGSLQLLEEKNGKIIDEGAVSDWLNRIYETYAGDYRQEWDQEYENYAEDFKDSVLRTLAAFQTDEKLEQLFYQAFDGIDVLPTRFELEYFDLMNTGQFIEAEALMVSIAYWQYAMLAQKGKIRPGNARSGQAIDRVNVALTEYDDDLGLLIFDE
ncbi:MAG: CRISPR-associated helicase Cas3' [Roseiflexus sp.]|nr:CRISPR-associated helicase Cas3' [Roseiflexus sp.]